MSHACQDYLWTFGCQARPQGHGKDRLCHASPIFYAKESRTYYVHQVSVDRWAAGQWYFYSKNNSVEHLLLLYQLSCDSYWKLVDIRAGDDDLISWPRCFDASTLQSKYSTRLAMSPKSLNKKEEKITYISWNKFHFWTACVAKQAARMAHRVVKLR